MSKRVNSQPCQLASTYLVLYITTSRLSLFGKGKFSQEATSCLKYCKVDNCIGEEEVNYKLESIPVLIIFIGFQPFGGLCQQAAFIYKKHFILPSKKCPTLFDFPQQEEWRSAISWKGCQAAAPGDHQRSTVARQRKNPLVCSKVVEKIIFYNFGS